MKKSILSLFLVFPLFVDAQTTLPLDTLKTPKTIFSEADDRAKKFLPQYAPLSPNASSFQKLGDYPVNLATGIPSVPIPLYTIQAGGLSVPITLNFHTGGFKLNEQASWVGFGAALDIGASMNRGVQGKNDDHNGGGYLTNPITASRDFCYNVNDYAYGQAVTLNQTDVQPDMFSYSTPRKSGKFILGQSGASPFKIPDYPIQISYIANPNISSIDLVDDDGTQYSFGVGESQTVTTSSGTQNYVSSWLISQIKSANSSDAITYSYQNGGGQYLYEKQWVASMITDAVPQAGGHFSNSVSFIPTYTTVSTSINQINPYKITYPNGEIEFIQSNAGERLDLTSSRYLKQINVYNYESGVPPNGIKTLIKVIKFSYSYFSGIRLKLDKITVTDVSNSLSEEHEFTYWSNTLSWNENTDNEKKDFWGYYNGKPNAHLIPVSSYNGIAIYGGAADRSTVSTYMKEGVLKRITFPSKGYSEFDYETNQYNDGVNNVYAGGLRVKSIVSNSGGTTLLKRYEYSSDAGVGIGKLTTNWTPSSALLPTLQGLYYSDEQGTPASNSTATQASFTQSGGTIDLNTMDAAPVYYTSVTEYFEDLSDPIKNGKNVYTFDFQQDVIVNSLNYQSRTVQPWKRGNLLTKTTYDKDNNIVSSLSNQYQEYKAASRMAGAYVGAPNVIEGFFNTLPCSTGFYYAHPQMVYSTLNYQTGIKLVESTTQQRDNVNSVQNTVYTPNLLVAQSQNMDSQSGDSQTENYVYPTDGAYSTDPVAQSMIARNMLSTVLESSILETISGTSKTVYQEKKVFDSFTGSNARGLSNNILVKELWSAPTGNTQEKRVVFSDYSTTGKPLSYSLDGVPLSLLWGYNDALLIGELTNATKSQTDAALSTAGINVNTLSVSSLSATDLSKLQDLRNALPHAQVKWYSYRPQVGMSGMVGTNGLVSRFDYDALNRLSSLKDHQSYLTDLYSYVYASTLASGCSTPAAPTISVSSSALCTSTLTASGCGGTVSWSNGSVSNAIVVNNTHTTVYTATCHVSGCPSSASNSLTIPTLPSPWVAATIGSPPTAGCVQYDGTNWTLQSTGNTYDASDNINFVYQSNSGNAVMVTKLNSVSVSSAGVRSGIMIRANTSPTAPYYQFFYDSGYGVLSLYVQDASTGDNQIGYQVAALPKWLRLKKNGSDISAWYSDSASPSWNNDADWTLYTSVNSTAFDSGFLMGLLVYNNAYSSNSLVNQTQFSNVSINNF